MLMGREAHEVAGNYIAQVRGTTHLNLVWGVKREEGRVTPNPKCPRHYCTCSRQEATSILLLGVLARFIKLHFNNISLCKTLCPSLDCSPERGKDPCANNSVMPSLVLRFMVSRFIHMVACTSISFFKRICHTSLYVYTMGFFLCIHPTRNIELFSPFRYSSQS